MRENRPYGSEGGEAKSLPYPYRGEDAQHDDDDILTRRANHYSENQN
jgi:hypothetical protein